MKFFRIAGCVGTMAIVLQGCGSGSFLGITPYRMELLQGNYVTRDAVAQLKPGMTREQVRFVMGTPLLTDIFHGNRWDYIFYRERSDGSREEGRVVVLFEDGQLKQVSGEGMPGAARSGAGS